MKQRGERVATFTKPLLTDELTKKLRRFVIQRRTERVVRLAPERVLAEFFCVSRPSLRAALKNLVLEGLIVQRQGSGTYIVPATEVGIINVMVAEDIKSSDPFFSEFIAEVIQFSSEQCIRVHLVHPSTVQLLGRESGPLIIIGVVPTIILQTAKRKYPHVIAAGFYPDSLGIPQVTVDHYRIGWEAARILSEAHHARVAMLCGPEAYPAASGRRRGFEASAKKHGLQVRKFRGKMNWRSGYATGNDLGKLIDHDGSPTAVFTTNDWAALGLMQRLIELGAKVPDDVSLIGCDDIHMAREISPSLSTFRWDTRRLLDEVMAIVHAGRRNAAHSHSRLLLQARYIPRETVRVLPVSSLRH